MAYQLRSRKDPASTETQEQTDTPVGNPTEIQVTTPSQAMFVPPQLSEIEHTAPPVTEASPPQTTLGISTKPETVSISQLDTEGPTRLDPGLGLATLSVETTLTGTHSTTQQIAPPSAVMASRDISLIGNQTQHLYETIGSSPLSLLHDSQEVKLDIQAGTTVIPRPFQ